MVTDHEQEMFLVALYARRITAGELERKIGMAAAERCRRYREAFRYTWLEGEWCVKKDDDE